MSEMVLTNNFYNYVRAVILSSSNTVGTLSSSSEGWSGGVKLFNPMKTTDGIDYTIISSTTSNTSYSYKTASLNYFNVPSAATSTKIYTFFKVGSGNTSATINDYNVENEINDINIVFSSLSSRESGAGSLSFLLTCTANQGCTISEICLMKNLYVQSGDNWSTKSFLLGRCVLDEPITLLSGGAISFAVSIKF